MILSLSDITWNVIVWLYDIHLSAMRPDWLEVIGHRFVSTHDKVIGTEKSWISDSFVSKQIHDLALFFEEYDQGKYTVWSEIIKLTNGCVEDVWSDMHIAHKTL